jgi:hypothetical protein
MTARPPSCDAEAQLPLALAMLDELLTEAKLVRAELRALRQAIEAQRRPRLAAKDLAALRILLPALDATFGVHPFSVNELLHRAAASAPLATLADRAAGAGTGASRRIGRLLQRCEGQVVAGLVVRGDGVAREGRVWRVMRE